ncbi:uncharacterized protein PITG_18485 [Phytophthora infestans T30-4]|uniref:Uncharacterized protein n=1 Tax=Phytophthora infestans (strain T30-4) TaxID=403677 RepID=D0NPI7_PHYIT|nr:uncharacterized protein PITG_17212 [Phytophthora infestans T30-4]XP_002898791.1 uncharacterized protein PITG_14292 [Phytophthora infestans T30-4]XP_002997607.1 uncharacterized protein PITG_18485 [Phytophthora infestans T30-4]EEY62549.1 hypothetical protein PITG_14292 [Phytophthora infestans T30-4]EEY66570.1 hypothetical protein PITG_17212 [Phytophthora infestans T30-4]EEY68049.1 hypothetical protein PITG_18485 [Phytophthora infestans T30-4]|eukprot:XP_002897089.1 hypothetical protein PITG_17212 [Phytophthora infestans T30-4]
MATRMQVRTRARRRTKTFEACEKIIKARQAAVSTEPGLSKKPFKS